MRRVRAFFLRLRGSFGRSPRERELAEELESLIALHIEDNIRAGMPPREARRQAILQFGGVESTRQECRDRLGVVWLETFLRDVRYAARSLAHRPMFTAAVVAILACGIGSTTSMFAVAQAILLPALPYAGPARLVAISETDRVSPPTAANVVAADFLDWQRRNTVFSGMSAYGGIDERGEIRFKPFLTGAGEARQLLSVVVGTNFFDVLGTPPMRGRSFGSDRNVAILSYACWQREFAADPGIIGRSIRLNGESRQVIGVMPEGFFFPRKEVDAYIPLDDLRPDLIFHDLGVVARLRPGVSLAQAQDQMATIGASLKRAPPQPSPNLMPRVESLPSMLSGGRRPAVLTIFAAAGVLFLIVCSNIAHLQLGRGAARIHEFAIRKALGAGRSRLIGQLLTESLLLSVSGGLLGFLFANAVSWALVRLAPEAIPAYADLRAGTTVVLFNLLVTLLAPLLFGIGPAVSATGPGGLGDRTGSPTRSARRMRDVLVAAEVALSIVLVVCAGLLVRSFIRLETVDLGFRTEHALTFQLDLGDLIPAQEQCKTQLAEIERRLLEQPGIVAAGASNRPMLGGGSGGEARVTIQGRERSLRLEVVTPGYFSAMRARLLSGRFPSPSGSANAPIVVAVNSAFERAYFPDGNSVGKQFKLGARGYAAIIGVVSDLKQEAVDQPVQPAAFLSSNQIVPHAVTFVVRGSGLPRDLVAAARVAVHSVNPTLPLTDVATLDELKQASIGAQRTRAALLLLVAGAALLVAALGVYGVLAYAVAQRTMEIGIRLALGAPARGVFALVLRDGMRPVAIGGVLGFAGAYAASRMVASMLFGVVPADPATYLLTFAILAAAAMLACAIPAARALRIDPTLALRSQ